MMSLETAGCVANGADPVSKLSAQTDMYVPILRVITVYISRHFPIIFLSELLSPLHKPLSC